MRVNVIQEFSSIGKELENFTSEKSEAREEVKRINLLVSSCIPVHTINNEVTALYKMHYKAKDALKEKDGLKACSLSVHGSPGESELRAGVKKE